MTASPLSASGVPGGVRHLGREAVVYQIYPRSFQDSNGDGIGDLRGIISRLDHLASLGVDALWLSPFYPSPNADFGYDISDYCDVDPIYGTLADFDDLVAQAHARNLGVIIDIVPCHTSIEHPWFREHPDWYIWSPVDGPANNWVACFGGPAWSRDAVSGRWYLHSFYPEQPDLNWRNPKVVEAMHGVLRFWRERGVDGFRLDAIGRLVKDEHLRSNPPRTTPPPLWESDEQAKWDQGAYHLDQPETLDELRRMRTAVPGAYVVAEVYQPNRELRRYLDCVDAAFAFEFLQAPLETQRLADIIATGNDIEGIAWTLSNHDFSRLTTRWGPQLARVAALMLLTLPGGAFIYQGDEIGMLDGPGGPVTFDRFGRDAYRHPMQWTAEGGFTSGDPWLPMVDPSARNVADQDREETSILSLYRRLLRLRPTLEGGISVIHSEPPGLVYRRGSRTIACNLGHEAWRVPVEGSAELETETGCYRDGALAPRSAVILRTGPER